MRTNRQTFIMPSFYTHFVKARLKKHKDGMRLTNTARLHVNLRHGSCINLVSARISSPLSHKLDGRHESFMPASSHLSRTLIAGIQNMPFGGSSNPSSLSVIVLCPIPRHIVPKSGQLRSN